jgi:hypothetical protein
MKNRNLSKYERECRDNETLLHNVVYTENYKHGYMDKLIPLAFSDTFTDKDFNSTLYSIAFSHGIDITRLDVLHWRSEIRSFANSMQSI